MGSFYGEGKGEGVWTLYQGEKCWLSSISEEEFRNLKKRAVNPEKLTFYLEKNGDDFLARFDQLELA